MKNVTDKIFNLEWKRHNSQTRIASLNEKRKLELIFELKGQTDQPENFALNYFFYDKLIPYLRIIIDISTIFLET